MKDFEDLAADVAAPDTLVAAERALGFIVAFTASAAGAILFCSNGEVTDIFHRAVSLDHVGLFGSNWRQHRAAFKAGQRVDQSGYTLVPIRNDAAELLAVVYLEPKGPFDPKALSELWSMVAQL